jgi:hypothetical protein
MRFCGLFFTFIIICHLSVSWGQSLVEEATLNQNENQSQSPFEETIKIISNSKKIFILTNTNQKLGTGDFISLALQDKLAARALVAKTYQDRVGIKILKIYSLTQWGKLRRGQPVLIVKGDDSQFEKKPEEKKTEPEEVPKIKSEEDLFNDKVVVEDEIGDFDESKNRHIKPDNIVAVSGAFYDAPEIESKGGTARTNEFGISWAYQFSDNFFLEALYGRALLDNYPGDGTQTLVNHLTARLKFNIPGPLYTFFMPYAGFHSYTVSSPDAGKTNNNVINQEELDTIDGLKKSGPVFGLTVMRRLVPGWFIKADIGNDIINIGFAIEF